MPPSFGSSAPVLERPTGRPQPTTTGPAPAPPKAPKQPSSPAPAAATKICIVNTKTKGPRCYYGIHAAVGPNASNARTDVLVVQYFLKVMFESHPTFQKHPFPHAVAVDGVAGPITFAAIRHFQRTLLQEGYDIATDGRVDPTTSGGTKGAISGTRYTILYLNAGYEDCRPGDYPKVSVAWDCPEELRPLFREPPAPPFY